MISQAFFLKVFELLHRSSFSGFHWHFQSEAPVSGYMFDKGIVKLSLEVLKLTHPSILQIWLRSQPTIAHLICQVERVYCFCVRLNLGTLCINAKPPIARLPKIVLWRLWIPFFTVDHSRAGLLHTELGSPLFPSKLTLEQPYQTKQVCGCQCFILWFGWYHDGICWFEDWESLSPRVGSRIRWGLPSFSTLIQ